MVTAAVLYKLFPSIIDWAKNETFAEFIIGCLLVSLTILITIGADILIAMFFWLYPIFLYFFVGVVVLSSVVYCLVHKD